jgi:hypothetical protein
MKLKLLFITIALFVGCAGMFGQINENFNTAVLPTGWAAVASPIWNVQQCEGAGALGLNGVGDGAITSAITNPNKLNFSTKRSNNSTAWSLQIQISNASPTSQTSGPWNTVATITTIATTCDANPEIDLSSYSGLRYVRFLDNRASGTNERAIDDVSITVIAGPDTTPPTVSTLSPADNATGVSTTGDLSLVFNESVATGTGNILIKRSSDNTIFETIAVTSALVTVSGATLTINPAGTFANSTGYYVEIPAGAIEDTAGNDYAGINGTTAWNFTTEAIWTNPITGTNPDTANPYTTGQSFNGNITVSGIGRGSGIGANNATDRYNANDWNSGTLNTNDYFEFILTPNVGYEINFIDFVYTSERNNTSIANFAFRSSVSTYTANIGTPTFNGTTISLSGAAYQNRTSATTFRIYAWGADTNTRTFSINDFTFNGTVIQTTIATDYFRSRASGTWATASNWESSRDNTNWITSTLAPTSAANTITIRDLHTITISAAVTADQITVLSGGTLALNGADLTLNNGTGTDLTIASGGTFDNGGESQITRSGTPSISISGTFITRDEQGFVGPTTAIPDISTTLNTGSTIEYGRAGNQAVQGSIISTYQNITISGSGTKTLASTIPIAGTILTKDSAIFDVGSNTLGIGSTPLTMQGTSTYKVGGSGVKPDAGGLYTLATGTTMEFTGTSATQIRVAPSYANLVVSGTNVKAGSTDDAGLTFQNPGTFTVKNGAVFKVTNTTGFTGSATAAIKNTSSPTIILEAGSTIEYAGSDQTITLVPNTTAYSNLTVSGTGTKTIPSQLFLGNNLSVNASTLRIESGKALTVTNNVVVSLVGATMTINDSGSLVQVNDAAVNTGDIRYERTTPLLTNTDYTYWSSPVVGYTLGGVSKNLTVEDKYYSFNSTIDDWEQASASTTMNPGIGYIIRGPEPTGPNPPSIDNFDAFFTGVPNNGIYPISGLSADKSYLLGNPYPSALDAEKFLNDNAGVLKGTLYFWTHNTEIRLYTDIITAGGTPGTGVLAYSSDDYATYNATGGVAVNQRDIDPDTGLLYPIGGGPSPSGSLAPSGKIATGQGFFASTKTTLSGSPPQILYNNNMRVGVINISNEDNSQFFKTKNPKTKTPAIEKHRIWLNLRNTQGVFKQTLIGYLTNATNQYDNRFDGETFDGNEFADFYSVNQDKNLVIQGRALPFDENDEVPLGFRTTIDGAFTINIDETDGVLTNQAVFIDDKLTNTIFDLRSGPYAFTTKSGTFNDRFVLRYTNKTLGINDLETLENKVLVSNKNKQIKINSNTETIDKVVVYDLLGRLHFKKDKVNNTEFSILNLISNSETLLVKVTLQNGETVTKKIIY